MLTDRINDGCEPCSRGCRSEDIDVARLTRSQLNDRPRHGRLSDIERWSITSGAPLQHHKPNLGGPQIPKFADALYRQKRLLKLGFGRVGA